MMSQIFGIISLIGLIVVAYLRAKAWKFSRKKETDFDKTSEMLDEDKFWSIIDNSILDSMNDDDQAFNLTEALKKLTLKGIIGFRLRIDKLLFDTYTSKMWCACFIMNKRLSSQDLFQYFRCWVISRSKNTFYIAKANPDSLISQIDDDIEMYEFESFWHVAEEAFKYKTDEDLFDYVDYDNFKTHEEKYPKLKINWAFDEPEILKKNFPKLFAKFTI